LLAAAPPGARAAARQRAGGVDVFIALDESGSMKPIFPRVTGFIADALVTEYLLPQDYLCIIGFSDEARVRVSQRVSSTAEKANLAEIVGRLNVVPQGYTDMGRVLEATQHQIAQLADPSHQQILLILTDGLNQPPRDSPYFSPLRPDSGRGLAPPSGFNARFLEQVKSLAAAGWRVHVVGIGADTDARHLAEALGGEHTVLRSFDLEELRAGLARFWDETIDLSGVEWPQRPYRGGEAIPLRVRLRSTSETPREIVLARARVVEPAGPTVTLSSARLAVAARGQAELAATVLLPPTFPPGDHRLTLAFDQESAVKFYPPQVAISFHVPTFWELHGRALVAAAVALVALSLAGIVYRRRPVRLRLMVEGEPAADGAKPVRLAVGAACSLGGGATDRLRLPGLPQKVALLERRSVDRFALLSTQPELVPTIPEYRLGDPVQVRTGPTERRTLRVARWSGPTRSPQRPTAPPPPRPRSRPGEGGVDFR
jgi:Mg-chelatase subunit ChlD